MSATPIMRVPKVWRRSVEAQSAQPGSGERGGVAAAQGRGIEVVAGGAREDEVLGAREMPATAEPGESLCDLRRHRDRAHLAGLRPREDAHCVACPDADRAPLEVDLSPPEGDELAAPQPGEGCGEEDRGVLLGRSRAHESRDLVWREDLDLTRLALRRLLDIVDRVRRQAPDLTRTHEDAVQHSEGLDPRALRSIDRPKPCLDVLGRDVLDPPRPERRQQVRARDRVVRRHGRRLAPTVVLDVAQELGRRVGERRPGPDEPRQRPPARLGERVLEPGLGLALGQMAGRRPPALGPRRSELLLDLASVRQAVLRVPDGSAGAIDSEDVPAQRGDAEPSSGLEPETPSLPWP
jgi:hypothetical protein